MKVIERQSRKTICTKCHSVLEWEDADLRWTHTEPDMYYVICPVCGEFVLLEGTPELDNIYSEQHRK